MYDAKRTELCLSYMNYILTLSNNKDFELYLSSFISPLGWKEFETILQLPTHSREEIRLIYKLDTNYNLHVMQKSQLLQMSSRSLSFVSKIIQNELYEIVQTNKITLDVTNMPFT